MAYQFDGSTGFISLPLIEKSRINTTVECWVNLPTNPQGCFIHISKASSGFGIGVSDGSTFYADSVPGNTLVAFYNGITNVLGPTITSNINHHLAFTYTTANILGVFYIDGSPLNVSTLGQILAPTSGITIGTDIGTNGLGFPTFTNAVISRVAIYTKVLSADRIRQHSLITDDFSYDAAVRFDGAIGYWRLDETSGLIVRDYSNNNPVNNGTINGGVSLGIRGPFFNPNPPGIIHRWRRHV